MGYKFSRGLTALLDKSYLFNGRGGQFVEDIENRIATNTKLEEENPCESGIEYKLFSRKKNGL